MRQINPGKYKHKIDILQNSNSYDEYGELTDNWDIYKSVYASKNPILGNEFFASMSNDTKIEVKFNSRYIAGVTSDMRIQHGSEIYNIISVIDVESRHEELLFYCSKI